MVSHTLHPQPPAPRVVHICQIDLHLKLRVWNWTLMRKERFFAGADLPNASDAVDRLRFEALTNAGWLKATMSMRFV